jgi:hypothetical protein
MKKFASILEPILKDIYQCKTLEEGKVKMKELIESTKIKDIDKKKMLIEIEGCQTLIKLQFYATNACFKYEALSVNSVVYRSKKK